MTGRPNAGAHRPLGTVFLALGVLAYLLEPARALDDATCLLWARAKTAEELPEVVDREALRRAYDGHYLMCRDWRPPEDGPLPAVRLEADDAFLARLWNSRTRAEEKPAVGSSGAEPGTPAWDRWCAVNFRRSFRPSDGTVILEASNRGARVRCPG